MKTNYELYLRTWNHLNPNARRDLDYETIDFEPCENYRDAVNQAKAISKKIPFKDAHGNEIVQVQIAAYYDGDEAPVYTNNMGNLKGANMGLTFAVEPVTT